MAYINGHELLFGVLTLPVGGSAVGEAEAASTAKSLTITDIGNYYLQSERFLADLQDMWNWDDDDALTWGNFSLVSSGNSTVGVKDTYTDTINNYFGCRISEGGTHPTTVKIVKSDIALLIDMSGGTIIFFSAVDSSGTTRKCVAIATSSGTYEICLAADDGTGANIYKRSSNALKRVTTSVYELIPFFDELASGYVKDDNVLVVRSLPAKANGLYKIGENQYYFGNYIALKDG